MKTRCKRMQEKTATIECFSTGHTLVFLKHRQIQRKYKGPEHYSFQ